MTDRWSLGSYSGTYPLEMVPEDIVPPPPEFDPKPPSTRPPVTRDLGFLQPLFRMRYELMLEGLRRDRFKPLTWETIRTRERGLWLRSKGRSKNGHRSMHIYGVAADTICELHRWQCHQFKCEFFAALGEAAHDVKLYWGGDWKSFKDMPHVQAIPVKYQNRIRAANDNDIGAMLQQLMDDVGGPNA